MDGRDPFDDGNPLGTGPSFDILDWYPAYESCQRYFLDHSQHDHGTQAVCALINIRLPCQFPNNPIPSWSASSTTLTPTTTTTTSNTSTHNPSSRNANPTAPRLGLQSPPASLHSPGAPRSPFVSPIPYIRRLVVTGFDKPAILHGFFGDDYIRGVMPHVECERRNYLFMAKHGGWRSCKRQYDVGSGFAGDESVPFMKPLDEVKMEELGAAERAWSAWLAMEDWMVGPRAPTARGAGEAGAASGREQGYASDEG